MCQARGGLKIAIVIEIVLVVVVGGSCSGTISSSSCCCSGSSNGSTRQRCIPSPARLRPPPGTPTCTRHRLAHVRTRRRIQGVCLSAIPGAPGSAGISRRPRRCALPARRARFGASKPRRQRGRSWNPSFTLSPRLSVADWPLPPRPADCRTPAAPAARRLRRRRHGVLSIFDLSIYAMR